MEVSVPCHCPASQEFSSNSASATTPNIPTRYSLGDISVNDLKMCLDEFLSIENIGLSTSCSPVGTSKKIDAMEDECKNSDESINNLPEFGSSVEELLFEEKGREGCKTSEVTDCEKSVDQSYSPPKSLPLVSAMKGSREKKGILSEKLSVSWAPDVYDPVPTSVSHSFPSSKNQQYRNYSRKYGKKKQRGGGKGKDKKQAKKNCNTTKSKAVQDSKAGCVMNSNVVSADPFCGRSILKESVNNLQFPVAEASG